MLAIIVFGILAAGVAAFGVAVFFGADLDRSA